MNSIPKEWADLKVILCHDWLTGMRGGERVLEILCRAFPAAPIYTLIHTKDSVSDVISSHKIITSFLQRVPGIHRHYRKFLPLFPAAIEAMRPEPADLIISTSHCVAKGLIPNEGACHLCYCFTPMRYAWLFHDEYFGTNIIKRLLLKPPLSALRRWDRSASKRVDRFVTLSRHVQDRISSFYGRESDIVYPPVNTEFWTPAPRAETFSARAEDAYDLIISALVPYKRIDLAVEAYSRSGRRLIVAGSGPDLLRLRAASAPNVEFTGRLPDEEIRGLYRNCRLLVFPGEEDFGIVPVEAMSCGRPVVAFGRGGALETVKPGISGVFFQEQTASALMAAVEECDKLDWDSEAIRAHALHFSEARFISGMEGVIRQCLNR